MANQTTVFVDGYDLSEIGVVIDTVRGHRSMTRRVKPTANLPGRIGPILVSKKAVYQPRRMDFSGTLAASSFTEMQTRLDALKVRLAGGGHTVAVADTTTRVYLGVRFEEIPATPKRPDLFQTWTNVALVAVADDPRGYSTGTFTVGSFGSTDTEVATGTAPSGGTIRVSGPASAPAVIYKSSTGEEIGRIALATTIGSTGFIDIDLDAWTFLDENSGNAAQYLNSTASTFFRIDPQDGDYLTSAFPTLQVTAGSAAHTGRKAYW